VLLSVFLGGGGVLLRPRPEEVFLEVGGAILENDIGVNIQSFCYDRYGCTGLSVAMALMHETGPEKDLGLCSKSVSAMNEWRHVLAS